MLSKKLLLKNLKSALKKFPPSFSVKNFFRAYINAIKAKTLFFNYPFSTSKTMSDVLVCLEKNSRIAGYKIFPQNKNVKVFLSYDFTQNKPLLPKIMYYSSQGRRRSATFKNLQQFHIKNPNFFYFDWNGNWRYGYKKVSFS